MIMQAKVTSPKYIPSLDGLRAVAVLIVLVSHVGYGHLVPGGFGVTVFFFLSGYLITTLLIREHDQTGAVDLGQFYLRRLIRLTPPLVLTLAGALALLAAGWATGGFDLMTVLSQLLFFYNYYSLSGEALTVDGLGVLWSLAVEEHFYLIWPAAFLLVMRGRLRLWHLVAAIGLILIWRTVRFHLLGHSEWAIFISTDTRFDSLLFGCLLALMQARTVLAERLFARNAMYPILAVAITLLLFTFVYRSPDFRSTFRYTLQGIALTPLFFYAVTRPDAVIFRPLNWGWMRRIGVWSYTIYLSHYVIAHALQHTGVAPSSGPIMLIVVFILSCGWAALVYQLAERPLHPLRRRLSKV